jgi:hypothetical protein
MRQKIKVVILPTEDKTDVSVDPTGHYHYKSITNDYGGYQHVYITVSNDVEPIEEGDWRMITDKNSSLYGQFEQKKSNLPENDQWSKIVATTDSLRVYHSPYELDGITKYHSNLIPQLQQLFLKEFVANRNGEFEVEYYADWNDLQYNEFGEYAPHKLKLNQNNEVNITSVNKCLYDTPKSCENSECRVLNKCNGDRVTSIEEKMYSREEMYLSAANVVDKIAANRGNSDWNMKVTPKMIVDNWIKENL